MEEIIYGITFFVYALFIIRTLLSWIGGDFDIDSDLDLGDIISFKGLTHFLMGSSGWLSARLFIAHTTMWYDYLIAVCVGIIFAVMLFQVYVLLSKLESKPTVMSGNDLIGVQHGFKDKFKEVFGLNKKAEELPNSEKKDENNFDEVK